MKTRLWIGMVFLMWLPAGGGDVMAQSVERIDTGRLEERLEQARKKVRRGGRSLWAAYAFRRAGHAGMVVGGSEWSIEGGVVRIRGASLRDLLEGRPGNSSERVFDWKRNSKAASGTIETAVALLLDSKNPGRISAVRVGDLDFPLDLKGLPLVWLGTQDDPDSLDLLQREYSRQESERVREDLVSAFAFHQDSGRVLTFLTRVLADEASSRVRREAVSGLGLIGTEEAVELLLRTIEHDASERVQREAVEALGQIDLDSSEQALRRFAVRHSASRIRRQAAESLGEMPPERSLPALIELVRDNPHPEVRREAAEQLAEVSAKEAASVLEGVVSNDPDRSVKRQALESLMETDGGLEAIIRMARSHPNPTVRKMAIRQLGESDTSEARRALIEIAESLGR